MKSLLLTPFLHCHCSLDHEVLECHTLGIVSLILLTLSMSSYFYCCGTCFSSPFDTLSRLTMCWRLMDPDPKPSCAMLEVAGSHEVWMGYMISGGLYELK